MQVTVGEPASSLFERPGGNVGRFPSQRRHEYYERYPERPAELCQSRLQKTDQDSDEAYFRRQGDRDR